jgi:hypothetical protein
MRPSLSKLRKLRGPLCLTLVPLLVLLLLDTSKAQIPGPVAVGESVSRLEEDGESDARSLKAAVRSIGILHGFHSLGDHVAKHDNASHEADASQASHLPDNYLYSSSTGLLSAMKSRQSF